MSGARFVLLNSRTLYPVAEIIGQPVADPRGSQRGGFRQRAQKAITVRAENEAAAALEILEAWGFSLAPCCDPREPGDYVCDECRAEAEAQTPWGQL